MLYVISELILNKISFITKIIVLSDITSSVNAGQILQTESFWLYNNHINKETNIYGSVSQGYKAGGVNQHPYLAEENRLYDPENILNFELGMHSYKKKQHYQVNCIPRST